LADDNKPGNGYTGNGGPDTGITGGGHGWRRRRRRRRRRGSDA